MGSNSKIFKGTRRKQARIPCVREARRVQILAEDEEVAVTHLHAGRQTNRCTPESAGNLGKRGV